MQAHLVDHEHLARAPLLDRVGLLPHAIDQLGRALLVRVRVRVMVRVRVRVRVNLAVGLRAVAEDAQLRALALVRGRARVRDGIRIGIRMGIGMGIGFRLGLRPRPGAS